MVASIDVVSGREGIFRVECRSTGGRALTMTVSGPDGYSSDLTDDDIQSVGTVSRTGSDTYTATTSDITGGGSDGDEYQCTVTGVGSMSGSVELRGDEHT